MLWVNSKIEEEAGRCGLTLQRDILEGHAECADELVVQPSYEDPPFTVVPGPSVEPRAPKGEAIGFTLQASAVEFESRRIVVGLVIGDHQLRLSIGRRVIGLAR
jgi:hypothetical protein